MEFIAHRINTVKELINLPAQYGVELDLRDSLDGRVYIQHNPFEPGEDFEEYLKQYHHGTMILNVKSERIEYKVLDLMKQYAVKEYFFLDSSFPMIMALSDKGEHRVALRFSEYEGLSTLVAMRGKVDWVWVDCFTKFPLNRNLYEQIKDMNYKICIVSPELQAQGEKIEIYKEIMKSENIIPDAICTKVYNIDRWSQI